MKHILFLALLFTFSSGYSSKTTKPEWINKHLPDSKYIYAVGYIEDIGKLEDLKQKALQEAKKKIAFSIFEKITVERTITTKGTLSGDDYLDQTINETIKTKTVASLSGVELGDFYYEEKDESGLKLLCVWVLGRITRANFESEQKKIQEELKRKIAQVDNNIKKAESFITERRYSDAISSYLTAAISSMKVDERMDEIPIYIESAKKIISRLVLEQEKVKKEVDIKEGGIVNFYVYYLSEGQKIPAENIKVRFRLRNNEGEISKSAVSDSTGKVECKIFNLKTVNKDTRVVAELDSDFGLLADLGEEFQNYFFTLKESASKVSTFTEFATISKENIEISYSSITILDNGGKIENLSALNSQILSHLKSKGYKVINYDPPANLLSSFKDIKSDVLKTIKENKIDNVYIVYCSSDGEAKYSSTINRWTQKFNINLQSFNTSTGEILYSELITLTITATSDKGIINSLVSTAATRLKRSIK